MRSDGGRPRPAGSDHRFASHNLREEFLAPATEAPLPLTVTVLLIPINDFC
jgi:hypothetical protein